MKLGRSEAPTPGNDQTSRRQLLVDGEGVTHTARLEEDTERKKPPLEKRGHKNRK